MDGQMSTTEKQIVKYKGDKASIEITDKKEQDKREQVSKYNKTMPRILLLSNARSGSTYLSNLLSNHPKITLASELLNDEDIGDAGSNNNPLELLNSQLSQLSNKSFNGFKVFCSQILSLGLRLDELVNYLGITFIIVLSRENCLETLTSLRIAERTGEWYSDEEATKVEKIRINPDDVQEFTECLKSEWKSIAGQWPASIKPIFVRYEDLLQNPATELNKILALLSCDTIGSELKAYSKRQNPAPLSEKIENWDVISASGPNYFLNVPDILAVQLSQQIPNAPDPEPNIPPEGWRYRVAEPYMPNALKQNVMDAIDGNSVSSAGYWPKQMALKLKTLFGVPVAQPCSSGFTALFLALQTSNIGADDEVIVPSFTMVAVSNAVLFAGAKPVFADSAKDDYNPGWEEIRKVSTEKTKAVILTYTYGTVSPDTERIVEECKKRGWLLIEDISECVGVKVKFSEEAEEKYLGSLGDFACASMYANKIIHAGDGGFILAKDAAVAERLTSLVNHNFTPRFHFVHHEPAINGKINGVGAAMACGCIDNIESVMEHRILIAKKYRELLGRIDNLKQMKKCGVHDTPWVFGLECESKADRRRLRAHLAKFGIETRDYFFPLHLQPANKFSEMLQLPNSEKFGSTGFYLPTHFNLTIEDVEYICSVVTEYFKEPRQSEIINVPPKRVNNQAIQIPPGSFHPVTRYFDENGKPGQLSKSHPYVQAVRLGFDAQECLLHENWGRRQCFLDDLEICRMEALKLGTHIVNSIDEYFSPYVKYFKSQVKFDSSEPPAWLNLKLESPEVATTTELETLQHLSWIIKNSKPKVIWEIGCWLGHTSIVMALAGSENPITPKIFACDGFAWQWWMAGYVNSDTVFRVGNSFLERFEENVKNFKETIRAVRWPYDIQALPEILQKNRPDMIYLDITRDSEDLERIWKLIYPSLIPNETVIVFNGLCKTSVSFFADHSDELVAIWKPNTIAKTFRFESNKELEQPVSQNIQKLKFVTPPNWTHHHQNAFAVAIKTLYDELHDESATTLFVPGIEDTICENPNILMGPSNWIGIIHNIESYPDLYYTPDLHRLCGPNYESVMKYCKGIFTLTQFQQKYLQKHLRLEELLPIQTLSYPMIPPEPSTIVGSKVLDLWKEGKSIDLIFVGSYARNYELFYKMQVPSTLQKVLLIGDNMGNVQRDKVPADIRITERLSGEEYEAALRKSIVLLLLKQDGAANTVILECIARNTPIVAPRWSACVEYLGDDYPLYYEPGEPKFDLILQLNQVEKAILYLQTMDKEKFQVGNFVKSIQTSALYQIIPPKVDEFDLTISINSYKRTHNLEGILKSLWELQDFSGRIQIIVWNNNRSRSGYVSRICEPFLKQSTSQLSLELIDSTDNYFCATRFALAPIMKSSLLLICDDDILPSPTFLSFFMTGHTKYPNDVLCVRGHTFLPHKLDLANPVNVWNTYDHLRFISDEKPEAFVHFAHADTCLIPREALRECASVKLPDATFNLVDDYWMSFILNHRFGRNVRKLSTMGLQCGPFERSDDSDTPGLALHTRPDVKAARFRLYLHHMVQGWPKWTNSEEIPQEICKEAKMKFWDIPTIGYNVSSWITANDILNLSKAGVRCVRIGAVGVGEIGDYEFIGFNTNIKSEIDRVEKLCQEFEEFNMSVVLTLDRRIASPLVWKHIAERLFRMQNVVGYDLINEPFSKRDTQMHWSDLAGLTPNGLPTEISIYNDIIREIRAVDKYTPIILEPTFWAYIDSLRQFPLDKIEPDLRLIVSFHFYEPTLYTQRKGNTGWKYSYPGDIPIYEKCDSSRIYWDKNAIQKKFNWAVQWGKERGVKMMLGEFGVSRELPGAADYLSDVCDICKDLNISGFLFSFRDIKWDSMNYELGTDKRNMVPILSGEMNALTDVILHGISAMEK